jgi:hypothetical protein
MQLLALDPGTKCGWAYGNIGQQPVLGTCNFKHDTHAEIFAHALDWIERMAFDALVIEEPIPPSQKWGATNYGTTQILLGITAIFMASAAHRDAELRLVPIKSWRAYALGNGNLDRAAAKAAALRLCSWMKWETVDDNSAEAAGIFLYGERILAPKIARFIEPLLVKAS